MELSLIIAIGAVVVGVLLLLAFLAVMGIAIAIVMRRSGGVADTAAADATPPPSEARGPSGPVSFAPSATPVPPPPPPTPPPDLVGQGLMGFFDGDEPGEDPDLEAAKTELFQRGAQAFHFDDDDDLPDQGIEAQEIYNAHGPAGDSADYAVHESVRTHAPPKK